MGVGRLQAPFLIWHEKRHKPCAPAARGRTLSVEVFLNQSMGKSGLGYDSGHQSKANIVGPLHFNQGTSK